MLKRFRGRHEHQSHATQRMLKELFHKPIADVLAETVYLIATHDTRAIQVIEHVYEIGLDTKAEKYCWNTTVGYALVCFDVYRDGTHEGRRCECRFELEYCDFIHNKHVDEAMLKRTCENIRRGMCCHVAENPACRDKIEAMACLLYIAAGSDNKDVVKLLMRLGYRYIHRTSGLLVPIHIALTKSCFKVLGVIEDYKKYWNYKNDNIDGAWLAQRDQETGKINQFRYSKDACKHCFIRMAGDESDEYVKTTMPLFKSDIAVCDLLKCLLSTGKEKLAHNYLQASRKRCTINGWYVTVYSVLLDEKHFLRTVLGRGFHNEEMLLSKADYTLLDIAHAFGSTGCAAILKTSSRLTDGLYQRMSPYTFLFKFAAAAGGMYPQFMVRMISKLHSVGHDVNHQDEFKMTPLLYALGLVQYDPTVIHKLLSIGADTDVKDRNGRTAMYCAITPYNSPVHSNRSCSTRGALKDILFYNPNVKCSFNQRAVHYAAERDLRPHSSLTYLLQKDCVVTFKVDLQDENDEDIEAKTYTEKVLALSYLALLHEFGFKVTNSLRHFEQNEYSENLQKLSDYLVMVESTPRTLQSACRLVIRQMFPGRLLHKLLQSSLLPKSLQDYVVRPYILRYVEVVDCQGTPKVVDYVGIPPDPVYRSNYPSDMNCFGHEG